MLIFCNCIDLDWGHCQKLKATCAAKNKNNPIKLNLDNQKTKTKQCKRKKQQQKHSWKQAKKCQDVILNLDPNEVSYEALNFALASFSASGFPIFSALSSALSPLISIFSFHFGFTLSVPVFLFVSCSGLASFLPVSPFAFCFGSIFSLPVFFLLLALALFLPYLTLFLLFDLAFPLLILALPLFLLSLDLFFLLVLPLLRVYFFLLSSAIVLFANNPLFKQEDSLSY